MYVLVASIASRGIDVDHLSLVLNFELPNLAESYVHRIGRTGRAGEEGMAVSFCNEGSERHYLVGIQKANWKEIEIVEDSPFLRPRTSWYEGKTFKQKKKGLEKK